MENKSIKRKSKILPFGVLELFQAMLLLTKTTYKRAYQNISYLALLVFILKNNLNFSSTDCWNEG